MKQQNLMVLRKSNIACAVLAICSLGAAFPAHSAESEIEALKAELAAQRALINKLMANQSATPAVQQTTATAPTSSTPQIGVADVKVYGVLDIAAVSGDSGYGQKFRIDGGGGMSASRLGVRVSKQLTESIKAVGALEGGLLVDTGTMGAASPGFGVNASAASSGSGTPGTGTQLFSRQAWAGLAGDFGQLTAGRQYTGSYIASAVVGSAYPEGTYGIAPNITPAIGGMPARVSNSIVWTTPKASGFYGMLSYFTGSENNVAGPTVVGSTTTADNAGAGYDIAALYTDSKLNVALTAWSLANNSWVTAGETGLAQKQGYQLSANYDFGAFKVAGTYVTGTIKGGNYENVTKSLSDATGYGATVLVPVGPHKFLAAYTKLNDNSLLNRSEEVVGLSYWYSLDSQTSLYFSTGKAINNANASYNLTDSGNLIGNNIGAGFSPTSTMVGLNFRF